MSETLETLIDRAVANGMRNLTVFRTGDTWQVNCGKVISTWKVEIAESATKALSGVLTRFLREHDLGVVPQPSPPPVAEDIEDAWS